jgi:glutamine synthetase
VTEQDAQRVSKLAKDNGVQVIDLRFTDLPGMWQHFTILPREMTDYGDYQTSMWVEGIGFDGSSIRGFQQIQESDMILMADASTARIDPLAITPTMTVICDVKDPVTKQPYSRDPRYIARKAEQHLISTGIADTVYVGPEAEFFVFDDIRFDQNTQSGYYFIDSIEGSWNSGADEQPNLGYKPRPKEGYFPVPPTDTLQEIRNEMVLTMEKVGITVEVHHHEVATAGQCEIDMRFDTLTKKADDLLWYKYIVKNVAAKYGKVATFMPKPLFGDNGSGMHTHQSLWKGGQPLFFDAKGYAMTSQMCRWYIGGLLKHGRSLMALCAPTTNSYKRLVPGYEAPVNLVYSARNRSAAARIPVFTENPKAKRIEFRPPDPTCNPYLAFSAMLMAGLDGIEKQIDPGQPLEKNTYELSEEESAKMTTVPGSLEEALSCLEADHEFLLKGGVFTQDLLDMWLSYKRENEIDPVRLRPHPWEFNLYFDV